MASSAGLVGDRQVMDLSADSLLERQKHEQMMLELKAKERAATLVSVPTLPDQVRASLREMGLPVRLFGENLAHVRDRLRLALAKREIQLEQEGPSAQAATAVAPVQEEQVTKYTRALPELIEARQNICQFSLARSRSRLERERKLRLGAKKKKARLTASATNSEDSDISELNRLDDDCVKIYRSIRSMTLQGSQYGDERPLSAICSSSTSKGGPLIATGGWSGAVKLWDGSSSQLDLLGNTPMAHEDRITGIAMTTTSDNSNMVATASIDLTGKLYKVHGSDIDMHTTDDDNNDSPPYRLTLQEVAHLKGHAARLCSVAFHPTHAYVGTTSFDHTWRLWDVETTANLLLLQDGHWKETYGIGFHPDGSLCATTDLGGVVQVWDLRTGKSVCHFLGHAKRVLCSEFAPNGFHLATAGDDGTIKVWDLRKRQKPSANIPAHSKLVSQLKYDSVGGEFLASGSFDGTAKVWSTRDYKMLTSLRGHEGKVMGVDVLGQSAGIVSSGYDKTIKFWK